MLTRDEILAALDEALETGQVEAEMSLRELLGAGHYADPAPENLDDAQAWDAWRQRRGYAGG